MNFWNERYGTEDFFYGTEPNDFLRAHAEKIPQGGRVLCLAEGEGRNALYLASLGYQVTAVDQSAVGLEKMEKRALTRGLRIQAVVADLSNFKIEPEAWDGIVSIWCHLPSELRSRVYGDCVRGLKKGGTFISETYHPRQLEFKTGGPPTAELLVTLQDLKRELSGLECLIGQEIDRVIQEGKGHDGMSAVVQWVGQKK